MRFMKLGQTSESNIFNQLDEKKRELAARGVDVINLSIGTPDFQPDLHVMQAVSEAALQPDNYKYSINDTGALIGAVQNWYDRRYGVKLDADQIMTVPPTPAIRFLHLVRRWQAPKSVYIRFTKKKAGFSTSTISRTRLRTVQK